MTDHLRETPLASRHVALGARMVPFAGWRMPIQYSGVVAEHMAVRESCGLFDVSHMGTVFLRGEGAGTFLQETLTNDVAKAPPGRAQYTMLLGESGGVVDDLIVGHLEEGEWVVVPNASNVEAVVTVLRGRAGQYDGVRVEDVSSSWGILAVQGPRWEEVLASAIPDVAPGRFHVRRFEGEHGSGLVSGTGYTGSPGVEILAPSATIVVLWDRLMEGLTAVGGLPAGLGARDTLRLEMGYPLHGHEITPTVSPLEAGLAWAVDLEGNFPGAEALRRQKAEGVPRRLVGLLGGDRRPLRADCRVADASGEAVGVVTSGGYSPVLERGIGLALVTATCEPCTVELRGRQVAVTDVKPPFVEP